MVSYVYSWFSSGKQVEPPNNQCQKPEGSETAVTVSSEILRKPSNNLGQEGLVGRVTKKEAETLNLNEYLAPNECQYPINGNENDIGRVFLTKDDGSCGLHSIFGEYDPKEATFILKNVKEKREEIANWIETSFEIGNPPSLILESLENYIKNVDDAPSYLQDMLTYLNTGKISYRIENIINKPGIDLRNKSLTTDNPLLRAAYVRHLREVSSYLSFEEVGAIAIQYDKKITIYTKFGDELVETHTYGSDQNPALYLVFDYNGKHFSKMLKKGSDQQLEETPVHFQVQRKTKEEKEEEDFAFAQKLYLEPQFHQKNLSESDLDRRLAKSLQRQFEQEEEQRIAQTKADFKLAQSLEAKSESKEDFEAFYDWNINSKKPYFLHRAVFSYYADLRAGQEIPLNLKNIITNSDAYKSYKSSLRRSAYLADFRSRPILQSPEWRKAYIEHLVSGVDLTEADLSVIKEVKERKLKSFKIESFYNWDVEDNRRMLIAAFRHYTNSLKSGKSIPEKLKSVILNPEHRISKDKNTIRQSLNKTILKSLEWKKAYIEHLVSGADLSEADLAVLTGANA